jgi:pyruvate dehydrogenase E2 component (dihydrolipoamide acetyltransferase)
MGKRLAAHFGDPPGDLRVGASASEVRVKATPLARALAAERGVDLRRLRGSGPNGRVVRADVEAAPTSAGPASSPVPADATTPLTPMRKTIAKRLLASHQDIPTFFLTVTLDGSAFVALREAVKAAMPDVSVSYNDMLLAAVARALREVPEANASWTDTGIVRHGRVDLGVAVAIPDGLITPVVRNADQRTIGDLAATVRALAQRAKAGKLKPDEYTGSTFTISNLGMMGIDRFTAIINPPEAAILAVGRMAQVPVVVNGQLAVGWRFDVTMTCDHRVLDGAVGAKFLAALKRYVESPALALI